MLSLTWVPGGQTDGRLKRVRELTGRTFGVNLALDFPIEAKLDLCLEQGVRIVSAFWGDPAR